jgi:hypothetical protein
VNQHAECEAKDKKVMDFGKALYVISQTEKVSQKAVLSNVHNFRDSEKVGKIASLPASPQV